MTSMTFCSLSAKALCKVNKCLSGVSQDPLASIRKASADTLIRLYTLIQSLPSIRQEILKVGFFHQLQKNASSPFELPFGAVPASLADMSESASLNDFVSLSSARACSTFAEMVLWSTPSVEIAKASLVVTILRGVSSYICL